MNTPNTFAPARSLAVAIMIAFAALAMACRPPAKAVTPLFCDAHPSKCHAPPQGESPPAEDTGLVCCGPGGCIAVATNAACGPGSDISYCGWGEQTTDQNGLPDVVCFD